jgi:hypothetical protein
MASFARFLDPLEVENVRAYLIGEAKNAGHPTLSPQAQTLEHP